MSVAKERVGSLVSVVRVDRLRGGRSEVEMVEVLQGVRVLLDVLCLSRDKKTLSVERDGLKS